MEIIKEETLEEMLLMELSSRLINGVQEIIHEVIECAH
jgi:hypothetical protein